MTNLSVWWSAYFQADVNSYEPMAPITQPLIGAQQEQAPPGAPNYGGTQLYNPASYQAPPQVHQQANPNPPQQIRAQVRLVT